MSYITIMHYYWFKKTVKHIKGKETYIKEKGLKDSTTCMP